MRSINRREFVIRAGAAAAGISAAWAVRAEADALAASTQPQITGDWPMWRHDGRLTGYQPLAGNFTRAPRIAANYSLGSSPGVRTMADLGAVGKKSDSLVCARGRVAAFDSHGKPIWTSDTPGYDITQIQWIEDLDGDGKNEVVALAGHAGGTRLAYVILDAATGRKRGAIDFLTGDYGFTGLCGAYVPGRKGKQIFLVTSCRQPPQGSMTQLGEFSLWAFDGAKADRLWAYDPTEFNIYYPAVMAAELDPKSPGRFFGVVDSWSHVWSIDLSTGKIVSHETWDTHSSSPRQYGWNQLIDVDGDGALDFVNVSMTKHVDVLRNDGNGRLKFAWSHGWSDVITTEKRALRPISDGILDVDGDGKMEVIAGLFDGLGDNRWHLYVWDAATGAVKAEEPDLAPLATVPLWGDKPGEPRALLCARSSTVQFDPPPQLEAWVLRDGKLQKVWTAPEQTRLHLIPPPRDDRRAFQYNSIEIGDPIVADTDHDGRPEFLTTDWEAGHPRAWGLSPDGQVIEKPLPLPQPAADVPVLPALEGNTVPYLLAADVDGDGRNEVLLYDDSNVTVLQLRGGELRQIRKIPSTEVPIVCNLWGDGRPCMLTGGRTDPSHDLYVEASGPDGNPVWRFVFPQSAACGRYSERPHYFTVGHFTGGKHLDVFTFSMKPQARAYVLDGRSGQPVYRKVEIPKIDRSFEAFGGRAAVWDYNGDGADDLLFLDPDYYCVADGRNGNLLVGPVEIDGLVHVWAAYASPAVLQPVNPNERPFVYLGGAYSSRCAITADGRQDLFTEYLPTERWATTQPGQRFSEGLLPPSRINPHWRAAHVEGDGTLRLFEADTGKHLWAMNLSTSVGMIVSGDVDGDGEPELLLGGRDGMLYCIGDAGHKPHVLWKHPFDAPIASVLMADVNADGKCEIIASVGDGYVYVLE